jgi:hypothetical protein
MSRHGAPRATASRQGRNFLRKNGPVAGIRNQQVIGSSPIAGSNRLNHFQRSARIQKNASGRPVAAAVAVDRIVTYEDFEQHARSV